MGKSIESMQNDLNILYPTEGFVFDTHTDMQNEFIEKIRNHGIDDALNWLERVKNNKECSYPSELTFKWEGSSECGYTFEISKNPDFSDSYNMVCEVPSCTLYNFEVGERYYWRVNGGRKNSFYTKNNSVRFIKIDGALNVRDVGGNKIKQGLIFRGSDLSTNYKITETGKKVFLNILKIKTEIELRKEMGDETVSAVGDMVRYKYLPYRPYKEIFEEEHRTGIKNIMEFLSNEDNYPVYIHCLGGADRTGMVALFLRALVGESDEMIHTDYELTSLSSYAGDITEGADKNGFRRRNSDYYTEFLDMLDVYAPSEPLSKKIRNFLFDCGVTNECIEKIIKIIKDDTESEKKMVPLS
ncbi:MAG: tyrosine-protein phosphatase [Clostridia bacterium]|nr:tyrosine-protein phosphatase [Clostridia bacterium]